MSCGPAVDVFDMDYWLSMASSMQTSLGIMTAQGSIGSLIIPPGVLDDARHFFALIRPLLVEESPANLPASRQAYCQSLRAMSVFTQSEPGRCQVNATLLRYVDLLKSLPYYPRAATAEEIANLLDLENFFYWMRIQAEEDAYNQAGLVGLLVE